MNRRRESTSAYPIPLGGLAVLAALAVIFLGVGAVADLPISEALYTPENGFATLLAAYGEAPALLALVAAGTLAWNADPPVHKVLRWLLLAGGGALIVVGTVALAVRPMEYVNLPIAIYVLIAITAAAGVVWVVTRIGANASWQAMVLLGAALFAVVAAEIVIAQVVKDLWQRPRMRMLVATGADFSPWWSPGYAQKDALMAEGIEKSEFASFPSGHTAHATVAVMLAGFAMLGEDIRRHRWVLLWIGAVWAVVVGISRITIGAHFLSDTGAAMLITLASVLVATVLATRLLNAGTLDRLTVAPQPPRIPGTDPDAARHASRTQ